MKTSKYAILYQKDKEYYVYHQLSKALVKVDSDLYKALLDKAVEQIPKEVQDYLSQILVLVDNSLEESDAVKLANYRNRYGNKTLRVTILPTLSCNFNCWYCYEKHKPSKITQESIESIFTFIKKEALTRSKKHIVLDFFGGEPLLCFDSIIYPFSKQMHDWCELNDITLHTMITTNGSLVNEDMALKMNEIKLKQFQITLDGAKPFHNKTRVSPAFTDSYTTIVKNIHTLCRCINGVQIDIRINYTPENVDTLSNILNDFAPEIKHQISFSPHIVWQYSSQLEILNDKIKDFVKRASTQGFKTTMMSLKPRCTSCYTENAEQYVINYNRKVYKCTAREYNEQFSIGIIEENGHFAPNSLYYKYLTTPSPFFNPTCLKCEVLPTCLYGTSCLQKKIEDAKTECCKDYIYQQIYLLIEQQISKP